MTSRANLFTVAGLVLFLAGACRQHAKDEDEGGGGGNGAPALVEVKLDSLVSGTVEDVIQATGHTDVLKRETVASPVGGKLVGLKVAEGQAVKAGQVVAVVRAKESESALEGAQAMVREARTVAEKSDAQRALELAESTQSLISLRSKSGGTVATRPVQEGEQVTENESLLTILDLSTLDFRAEVPLSGIGSLGVGQAATVSLQALPGSEFPARVEAILPQAQSLSQTLSIRLRFTFADHPAKASASANASANSPTDNARNRLKADMAGEARILIHARPGALLAPDSALLRNDETSAYTLVTMGDDSLAHILPVQAGATRGNRREVTGEGLRPGMRVVVRGQYGLADSTRLRPVP